jgi:hypothetical protein
LKVKGKWRIFSSLWPVLTLLLFIVVDLLLSESLDTNIIVWQNDSPSFKVRYFVPYTGGGTSMCYPLSLSNFNNGKKVIIKRSMFFDVCIVLARNRDAVENEYGSWLYRHALED